MQLYSPADGWLTWPSQATIDDDALYELDCRFQKRIGGAV